MYRHIAIVNNVRKWAAIEVPRCGCTTLKMEVVKDLGLDVPGIENDVHQVHRHFGYSKESSGGTVVCIDDVPEGYRRFAVWRDPVSRSISLWLAFCHGTHVHEPFVRHNLTGCDIDTWVSYVEWMLSSPSVVGIDPHVMPQSRLYSMNDVDDVVNLNDLSRYLCLFCKRKVGRINATGADYPVIELVASKLAKLYADDYSILYGGKTWRKTSKCRLPS